MIAHQEFEYESGMPSYDKQLRMSVSRARNAKKQERRPSMKSAGSVKDKLKAFQAAEAGSALTPERPIPTSKAVGSVKDDLTKGTIQDDDDDVTITSFASNKSDLNFVFEMDDSQNIDSGITSYDKQLRSSVVRGRNANKKERTASMKSAGPLKDKLKALFQQGIDAAKAEPIAPALAKPSQPMKLITEVPSAETQAKQNIAREDASAKREEDDDEPSIEYESGMASYDKQLRMSVLRSRNANGLERTPSMKSAGSLKDKMKSFQIGDAEPAPSTGKVRPKTIERRDPSHPELNSTVKVNGSLKDNMSKPVTQEEDDDDVSITSFTLNKSDLIFFEMDDSQEINHESSVMTSYDEQLRMSVVRGRNANKRERRPSMKSAGSVKDKLKAFQGARTEAAPTPERFAQTSKVSRGRLNDKLTKRTTKEEDDDDVSITSSDLNVFFEMDDSQEIEYESSGMASYGKQLRSSAIHSRNTYKPERRPSMESAGRLKDKLKAFQDMNKSAPADLVPTLTRHTSCPRINSTMKGSFKNKLSKPTTQKEDNDEVSTTSSTSNNSQSKAILKMDSSQEIENESPGVASYDERLRMSAMRSRYPNRRERTPSMKSAGSLKDKLKAFQEVDVTPARTMPRPTMKLRKSVDGMDSKTEMDRRKMAQPKSQEISGDDSVDSLTSESTTDSCVGQSSDRQQNKSVENSVDKAFHYKREILVVATPENEEEECE